MLDVRHLVYPFVGTLLFLTNQASAYRLTLVFTGKGIPLKEVKMDAEFINVVTLLKTSMSKLIKVLPLPSSM